MLLFLFVLDFQSRILRKLHDIDVRMMSIEEKLANPIRSVEDHHAEDSLPPLPCTNQEELLQLEKQLQSIGQQAALVCLFQHPS